MKPGWKTVKDRHDQPEMSVPMSRVSSEGLTALRQADRAWIDPEQTQLLYQMLDGATLIIPLKRAARKTLWDHLIG